MKRHVSLSSRVLALLVVLVIGYLLVSLWKNQMDITAKRAELTAVQQQLTEQEAQNQELTRSLADGEQAIIERIAREQGYARPNERIFVGY